jgi:hypothetical protein
MNSRDKGKRGEREFAAYLREHGFDARRGQQFAGGADSPDIICELLDWLHIEVKRVERLNLIDACAQAEGDCGRGAPAGHKKHWIVTHRRNHAPWLFTARMELLLDFIRGVLPPGGARCANCGARNGLDTSPLIPLPVRGGEGGARGATRPTTEPDAGRSATRPTNDSSAAACAVAINNKPKETNENPS